MGVVVALQCGEPCPLAGAVGAPDTFCALVGQVVDVGAAGVGFDGRAVLPGDGDPRLILGGVGPACPGDELDERVAVAEGCLVVAYGGDRTAVGLQVAGGQQGRVNLPVAVAGSARDEGADRVIAELA